jgi:hypothetical protein
VLTITVNADILRRFPDPCVMDLAPILIEDDGGAITEAREVELPAGAKIVYGPPTRSGARVWIEADTVRVIER